MADILATIHLRDGAIDLLPTWKWRAREGDVQLEVMFANIYSADYEYSPADGRPGARLASQIAKKLKGTVAMPSDEQKAEPGTIF